MAIQNIIQKAEKDVSQQKQPVLIISGGGNAYIAAVEWTANHTLVDGTRYLAGDLVYSNGRIYKANYENESMPVTSELYWTDLGPGFRLNIDGRDIQNIPTVIDAVLTTGDQSVAGIKTFNSNKTVFGQDNAGFITITDDFHGGELGVLTDDVEVIAVKMNDGSFEYGGGDPGNAPLSILNGTATFRGTVRIKDLYVTGTQTIVNTTNTNVGSNYILLNATGGAIDAGIFIVTGDNLTGINDNGAIIGYDVPANRWVFGNTTRNSDLSQLEQIASIKDIQNYSGFVNSTNSNIVFTTGNQNIGGQKVFDTKVSINTYSTGSYDSSNNNFRLNIGSPQSEGDGIQIDSYGGAGSSNIVGRRARGNSTNLSGLQKDDLIFLLQARGYSSGAGYTTTSRASLRMYTDENWTGTTNHGTYMDFRTTNTGSSTAVSKLLINTSGVNINNGNLYVSGVRVLVNGDSVDTIHLYGKNDVGTTIYKGQPVYISSADGANPLIKLASNTGDTTSAQTIGLLAQNLGVNEFGYIISQGILEGFNTSQAADGDPIWLGSTGDLLYGMPNKPHAPNHLVYLGTVLRSQNTNGKVYVKVQNGYEIEELHNVKIVNPQNNDILAYNYESELWINTGVSFTTVLLSGETDLSSTVRTTGDQTVNGNKTFENSLKINNSGIINSGLYLGNQFSAQDYTFTAHWYTGTTSQAQTEIYLDGINGRRINMPINTAWNMLFNISVGNSTASPSRHGGYIFHAFVTRATTAPTVRGTALLSSGTTTTQPFDITNGFYSSNGAFFITPQANGDLQLQIKPSANSLTKYKIFAEINQIATV